ncbi:hypothetical protein NMY22_g4501 [Coprinellus aureogranulatus]|nr:hypothetical protein NMY22_g4501 [Coprinellus aureogranulatus]
MAKGKESPYSTEQLDWLKARQSEYQKKTGVWKLANGQPDGKDDIDLSDWVGLQWDSFCVELSNAMDRLREKLGTTLPQEPIQFMVSQQEGRRHKTLQKEASRSSAATIPTQTVETQPKQLPTPAATKTKPFFLLQERAMTGQRMYEASVRHAVSQDITKYRNDNGLDQSKHASLLSSELSKRWKSLTPEEQSEWDERSTEEKPLDADQLTLNQTRFPSELQTLLSDLIGTGRYQIGNAAFQLQFAYRDTDETLQCGTLSIRPTVDAPKVKDHDPAFFALSEQKWRRYCDRYVPRNGKPDVAAPLMRVDSSGIPFFPTFDENKAEPDAVRAFVGTYLETQWTLAPGVAESEERTNTLKEVLDNPGAHIRKDLQLPAIRNPKDTALSALYSFIEAVKRIEGAQGNAIVLFSPSIGTGSGPEESPDSRSTPPITTPPLTAAAAGESTTGNEAGGASIHSLETLEAAGGQPKDGTSTKRKRVASATSSTKNAKAKTQSEKAVGKPTLRRSSRQVAVKQGDQGAGVQTTEMPAKAGNGNRFWTYADPLTYKAPTAIPDPPM